MNETVREWVEKAEADYGTASRELAAGEQANYDAVCYHTQQCVEKLMKALMIRHGLLPPRTHNLLLLDRLLGPVCAGWSAPPGDLEFLTRAGTAFRYPGATAEHQDATEAVETCTRLREGLLRLIQ